MSGGLWFTLLLVAGVLLVVWSRQVTLKREAHIRNFVLPRGLFDALQKRHPGLSLKDCQLVANALRQFFLTHLKSGRRYVSMPSQAADDLWHEFIIHTKNYDVFCRHAFGRFLHHTPAVTLGSARQSNVGLRRCWWYACAEEHINPRQPTRLPLLFAIDAKLSIAGGFVYVADCDGVRKEGEARSTTHCGGDFASDSFDGGTDGFGDAGGSGSGDGGGGDGGGCGGGGD